VHNASDSTVLAVNEDASTPIKWAPVDALPEVRSGLIGRDAIFRAIREGRIPVVKISSRRFLVRTDFLDILAREQHAAQKAG
jgi:hypothetical protein